jgi:hypothetical protein
MLLGRSAIGLKVVARAALVAEIAKPMLALQSPWRRRVSPSLKAGVKRVIKVKTSISAI